jgi:hypothetical protein
MQFSYLRTFPHLPFRDNTTNSFASPFLFLLIYTNMRSKGNRKISILTINKEAERRICGLRPRLKSKIAKCQQVYSLLVAINISYNESEMVTVDLRLCMSSPGNNFGQLSLGEGDSHLVQVLPTYWSQVWSSRVLLLFKDRNANAAVNYSCVLCIGMFTAYNVAGLALLLNTIL